MNSSIGTHGTAWRRFPKRLLPLLCLCLCPASLRADEFVLRKDGEFYTLEADGARLSDILAEIDRREPAALRFFGSQEGIVSAKFQDQTLDQLLYRLDVSYVLVYEADDTGIYRLDDAVLLGSGADGLDPKVRTRVTKLIRDLYDDDIPNNAHAAMYALGREGCAAVPLLEKALYADDYQARHLAASILRYACDDYEPSDQFLAVTLELLKREGYRRSEYWSLFSPSGSYNYLKNHPKVYYRVRGRLLENLYSRDPQERLLSAMLVAEQGEGYLAETLVRIMAPHLADNDLKTDAAAASHAMYSLGPAALPYLRPYVDSDDRQQSELARLIVESLETGRIPRFEPVMYVGYIRNPVEEDVWINALGWTPDKFPDEFGVYHNLEDERYGVEQYYGSGLPDHYLHVVGPGDTLDAIAAAYAVPRGRIIAENPRVDFHRLAPGAELLIPVE